MKKKKMKKKKVKQPTISKAVDQILTKVEQDAKKVMNRVGLTDEDMESIPMCSFEDFQKHLKKVMEKKRG